MPAANDAPDARDANGGADAGDSRAAADQSSPSTDEPKKVQVSHGIIQGMILHKVAPNYPEVARQRGVQGTVVIAVTIAKDGTVRDPRVISGDPLLNKAATEAVRKWRYRPYILKGEPVEVETTLEVHFTLN